MDPSMVKMDPYRFIICMSLIFALKPEDVSRYTPCGEQRLCIEPNVRGLPTILTWLESGRQVNHTEMCAHYESNFPEHLGNFSLEVWKELANQSDIDAYFNWTEKTVKPYVEESSLVELNDTLIVKTARLIVEKGMSVMQEILDLTGNISLFNDYDYEEEEGNFTIQQQQTDNLTNTGEPINLLLSLTSPPQPTDAPQPQPRSQQTTDPTVDPQQRETVKIKRQQQQQTDGQTDVSVNVTKRHPAVKSDSPIIGEVKIDVNVNLCNDCKADQEEQVRSSGALDHEGPDSLNEKNERAENKAMNDESGRDGIRMNSSSRTNSRNRVVPHRIMKDPPSPKRYCLICFCECNCALMIVQARREWKSFDHACPIGGGGATCGPCYCNCTMGDINLTYNNGGDCGIELPSLLMVSMLPLLLLLLLL